MNDKLDAFKWLEDWYRGNCDGDWEHGSGVKISTVDNPGWYVEISLIDTDLESKKFNSFQIERSESDWIYCEVKNGVYIGAGGTMNLIEIIEVFQEWAIH